MATDDLGGNPTDLSGVTFIGRQEDGKQAYHIRRSTGKVLGPFDGQLILQMIRGAKLTGDEGVSVDRQTWTPIMSVPHFADAFRETEDKESTQLGLKTVEDGSAHGGDLNPPPAPHPQGPSTAVGMASSEWDAAPPAQSEQSAARMMPSEREALSNVAGVRKISPDQERPMAPSGPPSLTPNPSLATSELPMPEGFTNFPLGENSPSFSLPTADPFDHQKTTEVADPPPLGFGPSDTAGTVEMATPTHTAPMTPPRLGQAANQFAQPDGAFATLETTGFQNLPTSAQGFSDLPASTQSELPQSADGRTNLPMSADGRSILPQSADGRTNLPQSASELPQSLTDLPVSAGGAHFGTMAMSGLSSDLPVAVGRDVATGADPFAIGTSDLPASARGAGTSVLDTMAHTDDIWAAPDSLIQARGDAVGPSAGQTQAQPDFGDAFGTATGMPAPEGSREPAAPSFDPFSTEAMGGGGVSGGPAAVPTAGPSDDFADFFPGSDTPEAAPGAEGAPADAPDADDAKPKKAKRSRTGKSWGLRIGLMVVLLGVLGGAALILSKIASGPGTGPDPVVVAPPTDTTGRTIAVTLPSLELLNDGSYERYVQFVDDARTAVGDRGTPTDRAHFLLAASILFVEHPDHSDVYLEMNRNFAAIEAAGDEDIEDPEFVAVARAAYLAATADDDALDALAGTLRGEYAAYGHFFSGIYEVQKFRGVAVAAPEPEPEPADDPADDSDEGAEAAPEGEQEEPNDEAGVDGEEGDDEAEVVDPDEADDVAVADEDDEFDPDAADEREAPEPTLTVSLVLAPQAASHFDAAIAAHPEFVPAHYWRGWVALELGEASEAESYFLTALGLNPEHVASDIGVARSLMKQARLADADARIQHVIDDFEAVSSSMQRSDTFVVAAEIAIARMQPEIAIESLLSALQANPVNAEAMRVLGEQFYRAGQYDRAREYFENIGDLADDDSEIRIGMAQALYGVEQFDEARQQLEQGLEAHPRDGRFPYWLGRVYEAEAEFELARQYYRQGMQIEPMNVRPLVRLAQLAERENMAADALRLLDEAMATNEGSAAMANEIGEMILRLGETNRAVSAFRRALELDGSHPDARINLTEYYLDSGQQQRAIEQLQIMLDSGVESPRVRFLNARALHGMQEYDRAIEELLVLQESDADNPDYLHLLGRVHFEAGNYSAARQQFVRAWEEAPTLGSAQYYIGRCDIELGAYNEAITSLTAASHRSASGEYHYWLGAALERASQPQQALSEYDQAINDDIAWSLENPEVFSRRGRLYYGRGAMGAAYRDLRTVLTLRPEHAGASWTLGRVHYAEREYDAAIAALEYSLALDDAQPQAHYVAGLSYLRLEPARAAEALAHFEASRDGGYGESEPELYQKLAYVYRDLSRPRDAATALEAYLAADDLPYDERRETENEIQRLRGIR